MATGPWTSRSSTPPPPTSCPHSPLEATGAHTGKCAEVLVALLCGAMDVEPGQPGGINLHGASVTGKMYLPGAQFRYPLSLARCYIAEDIELSEATTRSLHLRNCRVCSLRLTYATINGVLGLSGVHLHAQHGLALDARHAALAADSRGAQSEVHCSPW